MASVVLVWLDGRVGLDNVTGHHNCFCSMPTTVGLLGSYSRHLLEYRCVQRRRMGPNRYGVILYNGNGTKARLGYSIFSDLVCSLLPLVVLWNVKVSKNLKIAVCGLMSVGLLYVSGPMLGGDPLKAYRATGCAAARASTLSNNESEDLTCKSPRHQAHGTDTCHRGFEHNLNMGRVSLLSWHISLTMY